MVFFRPARGSGPSRSFFTTCAAVGSVVLLAVLSCQAANIPETQSSSQAFEKGLELYRENRLEEARPLFEKAASGDSGSSDAHAYLAETLRRLGDKERAVAEARKALSMDSCNSFGHTVLADAYYPMFGAWKYASEDSTWKYLREAVRCNPRDGNAWTGVWLESMRRGEEDTEKKALRSLMEAGFFAPPLLSYNRWVLKNLPQDAILLTNGDMDTYPAVALQEIENLRRDVCVVNLSLLNLSWYARLVSRRCRLPLPFEGKELDELGTYKADDGSIVTRSRQIVRGWLDMQEAGKLSRPLASAATVSDLDFSPDSRSRSKLAGPFHLFFSDSVETPEDTAMIRLALERVDPDDFTGSWVSPLDRSPVRITCTDRVAANVTALAVRCGTILLKSGKTAEALKWAQWAEDFEKKTKAGPIFTEEIQNLKDSARQGLR